MNNRNPFEYMQSFMNQEAFTKAMQNISNNIDFASFSAASKNTADTISATNQTAAENIQTICRRGAEIMKKNTAEMYNTIKDAVLAGDANQIASCRQKYLQTTLENGFNSTKEIIDISTKSMIEIMNVMQNNIKENTDKVFSKNKTNK